MSIYQQYETQLNKLLEDEKNIFYFCDIVKNRTLKNIYSNKKIIDLVIEFCDNHDLDESKAWMYYYLGWNYIDLSQYNDASKKFNDAKDIFEKRDNKLGLAYAYSGLASVYCRIGTYQLSNEMGLRGIAIAREIHAEEILINILINISITNINSASYEAAKEILDYIEINYDYNNFEKINSIRFLKTKAEVEFYTNYFDKASEYIKKAIEIDEIENNSTVSPRIYKISGMIKFAQGEIQEAEEDFRHSCELALKFQNTYDYCDTLIEHAKLKYEMGQVLEAIKYLDEIITNASKINLNNLIKKASNLLYEHYKSTNQYELALSNLEIFMKADSEIHNYKDMKLTAQLNIDHGEKELKLYKLLYDKTEILYSIGEKIISNLDMESLALSINSEINKLMKLDFFAIASYDADKKELMMRTVSHGKLYLCETFGIDMAPSFSSYCIKNKKTIVIDNVIREYKKYIDKINLEGRGTKFPMSGVYVPLIINDEIIGIMIAQSLKEKAYDSSDVSYLKIIGNYAAIALKNALEYNKMEQIATYDSLTGFLTRREILKEGNKIRKEFNLNQKEFCILMLDLDDFKYINDRYGHVVGDNVMKMLANNISSHIRASDYIGRYGGDEFLLICPNMNMENAFKLAERIRKSTEETKFYVDEDTAINVTLSIGLYEFSKDDLSFIEAVNFADMMLYKAKNKSKNKIMCFNNI